ncbi:MAG: hypothetical protein ACRDRX_06735 [Pseudonocardiaceae bacterium]
MAGKLSELIEANEVLAGELARLEHRLSRKQTPARTPAHTAWLLKVGWLPSGLLAKRSTGTRRLFGSSNLADSATAV